MFEVPRMNFASFLSIVLAAPFCSGCILAMAAPPGRADVGPALMIAGEDTNMTVRFSTGVHAASFIERRVPYDLGLGYVLKSGEHEPPPADAPDEKGDLRLHHGAYLEAAYGFQLGREEWSWSWIGARGELMGDGGWGMFGRWAWETSIYVEDSGGGGNAKSAGAGVAMGRVGIGFFAEGGYQSMPEGSKRVEGAMISLGLAVRFPAFAFAGFFLPTK